MINRILTLFQPHTHSLFLVSDPDNVLNEEQLLVSLAERGFSLVQAEDCVQLRVTLGRTSFSQTRPTIVITQQPLNQLPYDLWQQGHPISLQLSQFFPNLAYPVVRQLSSEQRWQLNLAAMPTRRLGDNESKKFVLQHVFGAEPERLKVPAQFILWLSDYHQRVRKMPAALADYLLSQIQSEPVYDTWPLADLIGDKVAFSQFINGAWQSFIQSNSEGIAGERSEIAYQVAPLFAENGPLQDTLPALVRTGALTPVSVLQPEKLPAWAKSGVVAANESAQEKRAAALWENLEVLREDLGNGRWEQWQQIARTWASLTNLRYAGHNQFNKSAYAEWQARLDNTFVTWLQERYGPLGVQRLPVPHHVHHLPYLLAIQHEKGQSRHALLILDGLSLGDWQLVEERWQASHRDWEIQEQLVLAQVPSITAVSRQALVSGLRPADFSDSLHTNQQEAKRWQQFWMQKGLPSSSIGYSHLKLGNHELPVELGSSRIQILCLVNNNIDKMLHGASLGAADVQGSLRLWLEEQAPQLETIIADLLQRGFLVTISSDHGHVEARGVGQPSEGLAVETRSKRARIYRDENTAVAVQRDYPDTILWHDKGLLPRDGWVLLANGRTAFAPQNEVVVTHGGLTLDEMIVPLVQIKQRA